MAHVLTSLYALASGFCVVGWSRWKRALDSMPYSPRLNRLLASLFWCLSISMFCTTFLSVSVWNFDGTDSTQRWILYGLCIALIPQTAVFAFVFTPIAIRIKGQRRTFIETVIRTECCFLLPVVLLVGLCLWFLAQY